MSGSSYFSPLPKTLHLTPYPDLARGTTETVGKTVGGVTDTAGNTGPSSPFLCLIPAKLLNLVSGLGNTLGDTVKGLTGTVGDTAKNTGNTVENTTDSIGESIGGKKQDAQNPLGL